ncbi:hypothetical protein HGA88_06355 [Candidatus Roizmanbacteria bacterium]|nr:hypothetical protein [Candidatus Roizmanbacteria bacterium]
MDPQNQSQVTNEVPQEIKGFLESLIADSGLTIIDDQVKEQMIQDLFVRLDDYIASEIADKLEGEDFDTFVKMNEDGKSREEIEKFLQEKLPNAQEVFINAFTDFRNLYLGNVAIEKQAAELDSQQQKPE